MMVGTSVAVGPEGLASEDARFEGSEEDVLVQCVFRNGVGGVKMRV